MNEERRNAIVRLLETRNEHLPEIVRDVGVAPGFVHAKRSRTCPDCLANGRVSVHCETCGGGGVVEGRRFANVAAVDVLPDDGLERDPYAKNEVQAYGLDGARHDDAHARDRAIDTLDRQLRPPRSEAEMLEEANRNPYPWERARDRMRQKFDYAIVDVVLDELRAHDPNAYRALHAVYVYGWLTEMTGSAEQACERGLAFISPRLAAFEFARGRKLRAPGVDAPAVNVAAKGRHDDPRALEQRNAAIRAAIYEDQQPTATVAASFGLTVSQVNRIARDAA